MHNRLPKQNKSDLPE